MTSFARKRTLGEARPASARPGGFTLIELLVVMAIITVLLGLIGGVGVIVLRKQKVGLTQNVLVALDRALDEYLLKSGAIPPYIAGTTPETNDYDHVPGEDNSIDDAKYFSLYGPPGFKHPKRPDAAVFLKQAIGTGEVQSIIAGLGDKFLVVTRGTGSTEKELDTTPSVIDAWGSPQWLADEMGRPWSIATQQVIYFVHPQNKLAQDLYGQCKNGRPYFLSAGADLKYGFKSEFTPPPPTTQEDIDRALEDNVYSYAVGPFNKVPSFFSSQR